MATGVEHSSDSKSPLSTDSDRLAAIDWMRGLVMVLMAIDHASVIFNGGRLSDDSWYMYQVGSELPVGQFFTRWITHLCAPTFVFLAGTALALSFERRRLLGDLDRDLDRRLFKRALVILAFELLWWSPLTLQVLFAIAMGLICMIPLRRLSTRTLLISALSILFLYEAIFWGIMNLGGITPDMIREVSNLPVTRGGLGNAALNEMFDKFNFQGWITVFILFLHPGNLVEIGPVIMSVTYPFVPWLGMMILGWLLGRYLLQRPIVAAPKDATRSSKSVERLLVISGMLALGLFVLFRAWNGYGNMLLLREDFSLVQWLHINKYPPSLTFALLELGLMALILWGFFRFQRTMKGPVRAGNPLLVFGQTAFFFYLLHLHIMIIFAIVTTVAGVSDMFGGYGLGTAYLAALGVLILLYPLCLWFRRFKAARPKGWVRYI